MVLTAQTYVPFISTTDSSDTWKESSSILNSSCFENFRHQYRISGDTTIGNYLYAKLFVKSVIHRGPIMNSQFCNDEYTFTDDYYYGAIRESDKKIYVIATEFSPSEYLAYDFNLTIGDTMPSPRPNYSQFPGDRIIVAIDSVLVFGSYRKRYYLGTNMTTIVIEGIGTSKGLFTVGGADYQYMDCYTEYGVPGYFDSDCLSGLSVSSLFLTEKKKDLVKIVDFLGRETEFKSNTLLLYIYSDGTTEKVFQLE